MWVEEEEEEEKDDKIDGVQSRTEIADPRYNVWVYYYVINTHGYSCWMSHPCHTRLFSDG